MTGCRKLLADCTAVLPSEAFGMEYALIGYGRTGREVEKQARRRGHRTRVVIDPVARGGRTRRRLTSAAVRGAEVAFEFTEPGAAHENVLFLVRHRVPVVCGTTGWQPDRTLLEEIKRAGVPVVLAPNFSIGMNLFFKLVGEAAKRIGSAGLHDPYILESHHRGKKDSPSGTAAVLAGIVSRKDPRKPLVHAGDTETGLPDGAMHVASVRTGHEPGKHVVGFDGEFDVIELIHSVRDRGGLALGAVLAAEWVIGRKGELYGFDPVLEHLLREGGR